MVNSYTQAPDADAAQAYRRQQAVEGKASREREAAYDRAHSADQGSEGWEGRLYDKEQKKQKAEKDRKAKLEWAKRALPNTPVPVKLQDDSGEAAARAQTQRINDAIRAKHERERVEKTAASTGKLQQEIAERDGKVADMEARAAAPAKGLPSIFVDPGALLDAMKRLDTFCQKAWVYDAQKRAVPTAEIAKKCSADLMKLHDAVARIVSLGKRDLVQIAQQHKGWVSNTEVLQALGDDFKFAESRLSIAQGKLTANPPAFFDGTSDLVAALRFNKRASDAVDTWSKESIAAANTAVVIGTVVRSSAITALEGCVMAAAAPAWGAGLLIHGGFVVLGGALEASDAHFDGKEVPWAVLSAKACFSMLLWSFGRWFDQGLDKYLTSMGAKYLVQNGVGATKYTLPQALALLGTKEAFDAMKFIVSEELELFAAQIFERREGANKNLTTQQYCEECLKKHFSKERIFELVRKNLLDHGMAGLRGAATPKTPPSE